MPIRKKGTKYLRCASLKVISFSIPAKVGMTGIKKVRHENRNPALGK